MSLCGSTYHLWASLKTKSFSATCGHTSGILECQTAKRHRDHLFKLLNSNEQYLVQKREGTCLRLSFQYVCVLVFGLRSWLLGPFPGYHMADKVLVVNHSFLIPFVIILLTKAISVHCWTSPIIYPLTVETLMYFLPGNFLCHYCTKMGSDLT